MIGRMVMGAVVAFVAAMAFAAAPASAGGFSTVGLTSPPPPDVEAGQAWDARFTVLAHGRTPLEGLTPVVRIERADGDGARNFEATETGAPGTYRARVVFPAEGRWTVEVAEHRAMAGTPVAGHSFGVVDVGASAGEAGSGDGPGWLAAVAIAVALGLLAAGGAWLVQAGLASTRPARSTESTRSAPEAG